MKGDVNGGDRGESPDRTERGSLAKSPNNSFRTLTHFLQIDFWPGADIGGFFLFRFFHIWGNWDLPRAIERGAQARTEVREDRRAPRPAAPWRLGAGPGVPYPQAQLNRQSPHAQHHTLSLSLSLKPQLR